MKLAASYLIENNGREGEVSTERSRRETPERFPHLCTGKNRPHVTSNLDRGCRRPHYRIMRPDSSHSDANAALTAANPLFRNILPLSPFDPIFCREPRISHLGNSKRISILPLPTKKNKSIYTSGIHPRSPAIAFQVRQQRAQTFQQHAGSVDEILAGAVRVSDRRGSRMDARGIYRFIFLVGSGKILILLELPR